MAKVYWRISFLGGKGLPVALEVAAHYANTEERDKRQDQRQLHNNGKGQGM